MKLRCPKILLLFELNETLLLLHRKKDIIPAGYNIKLYESIQFDEKIGPYQVKYRPGRQQLLNTLFLTTQNKFETAIFSSLGKHDTELIGKAYFGRYYRNLLFSAYTRRQNYQASQSDSYHAIPIKKQLGELWKQHPQFDNNNTLVISPHHNQIQRYRDNDLIIPSYTPSAEGVGFLTDPGVLAVSKYLRGLLQSMNDLGMQDVRPLIRVKSVQSLFNRVQYNIHSPRQFR